MPITSRQSKVYVHGQEQVAVIQNGRTILYDGAAINRIVLSMTRFKDTDEVDVSPIQTLGVDEDGPYLITRFPNG